MKNRTVILSHLSGHYGDRRAELETKTPLARSRETRIIVAPTYPGDGLERSREKRTAHPEEGIEINGGPPRGEPAANGAKMALRTRRWRRDVERSTEAGTDRRSAPTLTRCRSPSACSIRRANPTPAASASSPISRARSRTRSSRTRSPSCSISSTAAPSAPTRARATAPASSPRFHTSSSRRRRRSSASSCRSPAATPSVSCSCRATRNSAGSSSRPTPRKWRARA